MITNKIPRVTFIIIGVLVILALAFFAYKLFIRQQASASLPSSDTAVAFLEAGMTEYYYVEGNELVRDLGPIREDGILIRESAPSPLNADDGVVLFSIPGERGMFMGVAHPDGTIDALVAGETNKAGLVVLSDGTAVFAAVPAPAGVTATPVLDESGDDNVAEMGSASGPVDATASSAPAEVAGFPQLLAVNIGTRAISSLGLGYSPRLLEDGSVLAIAPEGVVSLRVAERERAVVLPQESSVSLFGALSPSGSVAALPSPDNASIEFYWLSPGALPESIGFLDRTPGIVRLSLVDDEHLFVRTGPAGATYYQLPTEKLPVATPVAIVPIIQ